MFSQRNLSLYGGHNDEINCLVFSSDFEILLTGSIRGCLRIWNTVYDYLNLFKGHTHVSDCLQFSLDHQFIASGGWDCRTILWNVIVREKLIEKKYSFCR
jgi:WD40 repeat protein